MSTKLNNNKVKTHGFIKNEKNAEINRENQILLNKLVEISNGKWSSVAKVSKTATTTKKAKPVLTGTKKSLNYERRRKEFERIERENMAIAQRLFNKQGSISKKKMDEDYGVHKKYKKQIQKLEGKKLKKGKGKKGEDGQENQDHKEEEDDKDQSAEKEKPVLEEQVDKPIKNNDHKEGETKKEPVTKKEPATEMKKETVKETAKETVKETNKDFDNAGNADNNKTDKNHDEDNKGAITKE